MHSQQPTALFRKWSDNFSCAFEHLANGNTFTITIPTGALRVMFAYPATLRDVTSVQDVNGMNAEIKSAFTLHNIEVEGASGYTAIGYKVYVMDLANANDTANTYKVTI